MSNSGSCTNLCENGFIFDDVLICGEKHIELAALELLAEGLAGLGGPLILNLHHGGRPLLKLQHPVGQCPRVQRYMSLVLGKLGLTHVHKVWSQISLCRLHRLIRDSIFRFFGIFHLNEVSSKKNTAFLESVVPDFPVQTISRSSVQRISKPLNINAKTQNSSHQPF